MKTKKSNLYLFTFLGIFLSLFLVGASVAPFLMDSIRTAYITMQTDVNKRQAESMARILQNLLGSGESEEAVLQKFQAALAGSEVDRGYLCLIDEGSGKFLCHPNQGVVGQLVSAMNIRFTRVGQNMAESWEDVIKARQAQSGVLNLPGGGAEIVYSVLVPGTPWRVFSHENTKRVESEIAMFQQAFLIGFILLGFIVAFPASFAARRVSRKYEKAIVAEQEKSERLLLNILPQSIAQRLKQSEAVIADRFENISVLFADMVNFTQMSAKISPEKLVELLNYVFSQFDEITRRHGLEKIKTIGDSYMLAGGVPVHKEDHLEAVIQAACEMLDVIKKQFTDRGRNLQIRIGLHTGPAVAGVIGSYKFTYDLWGETVNLASRLESSSLPGEIHCSEPVYLAMKDRFQFQPRGKVMLKGVGEVNTYLLVRP